MKHKTPRYRKMITKHSLTRKHRTGKRRKGILWDYNYDGIYLNEHIKGFWKKYWRKWNIARLKKEMEEI